MDFVQRILAQGFRLGSLFGIPVTVNGSLLPIALLLIVSLSSGMGFGFWSLPVAVAGTVLLFASILLHELGHALMARGFGIQTAAITLHFFGGVARILREPSHPRQEFCIAAAGPAVSLALGFVCWVLTKLAGLFAVPAAVAWLFFWLAQVNLMLGIFNLLPGFPMDGGRLLRAWIWSRTRDVRGATVTAAKAGEGVGVGLMVLGVFGFLGFLGPFGLMTIFIGWFIRALARAEKLRAAGSFAAHPVPVRHAAPVEVLVTLPDGRQIIVRKPR